ncbi:response regulator [Algoriphagus halophytocola]|uniref:Response regulator n=1 Tax=Algoriphagus halophytocola TaxID=2991499 RepID=A0ABY6MG80_9BACT|nr:MULTISPECIES: response regulator [unclassified Algoriphagus]UZD22815.1 response regulator [Algoriphagus sp. TR-M5]WBL44080.1 response regulator [Algoriphagus sp. TR-M9]
MTHFDTIFLVDDDPINNLINKRLISKVGVSEDIVEFLEAEEALIALSEQAAEKSILIFLDINMPVLNGWEFLDKYGIQFPQRKDKIVILSSSIDFNDREKAKTYDTVSGFLEKPLTIDKIKDQLT